MPDDFVKIDVVGVSGIQIQVHTIQVTTVWVHIFICFFVAAIQSQCKVVKVAVINDRKHGKWNELQRMDLMWKMCRTKWICTSTWNSCLEWILNTILGIYLFARHSVQRIQKLIHQKILRPLNNNFL